MDAKRSRRKNGNRLRITLLVLLLGLLTFANLARTQTDNQEIRVKIYTGQLGADGRSTPLSNVTVKVGPSTVTTDAAGETNAVVPRGKHNVKASRQGFVVSQMSISPTATGMDYGTAPANSDEGDIEFSFLSRSFYEEADKDYTLFVRLKPGTPQSKEAIRFHIVVETPDCKIPDYKGLKIGIGNTEVTNFDVVRGDDDELRAVTKAAQLKPGNYEVGAHVPLYNTEIIEVEVQENVMTSRGRFYPKDKISSRIDVTLDERIWESTYRDPALRIKLAGNCPDPDFSSARIISVTGKVEIVSPDASGPKEARVNERVGRRSIIRTGVGGLLVLESRYGHIISIDESTELQTDLVMTGRGREKLEFAMQKGKVQIKRVKPDPSMRDEDTGVVVKTSTARVIEFETIYAVSHDATTNATTIEVEEGRVEVTPANSSLQPFELAANQQVKVTDSSVGAITYYSGSSRKTGSILLYVGLGIVGLLVLLGLFYFFRRQHRLALHPAAVNPARWNAPVVNFAPPAFEQSSPKCPNPRCGKQVPPGEQFCAHCGAGLNV